MPDKTAIETASSEASGTPSVEPWQVHSSRSIWDRPWFKLRADTCDLPNGTRLEDYAVVEAPDWCHVLALTPERKVVLVRQYRHALGAVTLELPGGIVDEVATQTRDRQAAALTAAQRELREETGYGAGSFAHVASLSPNPARYTNLLHIFVAQNVHLQGTQRLDSSEDIAVVLRSLEDVMDLATRGEMMNSVHVGALFLAHTFLKTA